MDGARFPAVVPVLRGEGITLREMCEEDLPGWFARRSDADAAVMAGDPVARSMADVEAGLAHHRRAFAEKRALRWAIVVDELAVSVGSIGLDPLAPGAGGTKVGAAVGRTHWGNGIATRAGRLVLAYAFDALGLERVDAVVLPENVRVARALRRLGFARGASEKGGDDVFRDRWTRAP